MVATGLQNGHTETFPAKPFQTLCMNAASDSPSVLICLMCTLDAQLNELEAKPAMAEGQPLKVHQSQQ